MKKILLGLAALSCVAFAANSQTRFVLYEEFTGENCGPCAATNPGLLALMNSGTNPSKILMIKYMSPIPTAGPLYAQNSVQTDARLSYYGVTSAPNGRMDGITTVNGGHPGYMTQTIINTEAAIASPFNMTVTSAYTSHHDSVIATVTVTAVSAYVHKNTIKLRTALTETMHFATPPGTNGEKSFENVVRTMYPGVGGLAIDSVWAVNDVHTYTVAGPIPSYVDKAGSPFMTVWIQNDSDKNIAQAGMSAVLPAPPLDLASSNMSIPSTLSCATDSATITPIVTIKNIGTTIITSANVYYKIDVNGTWQGGTLWTGSLAKNATAQVTLSIKVPATGTHTIYDSVGYPNALEDQNVANNISSQTISIHDNTNTAIPNAGYTFESTDGLAPNWILYDPNNNGYTWQIYKGGGGYRSNSAAYHYNKTFPAGDKNYIIMPAAAIKTVVFTVAFAQSSVTSSDALDIVYSTDCGQNWTSVWHKAGADLATVPITTTPFMPSSSVQWKTYTVDISAAPAGAMFAYQATAGDGSGNALWIDDLTQSPWAADLANVTVTNSNINVYPNPTRDNATVSVILDAASNVHIDVLDAIGRIVTTVTNENMSAGTRKFIITTDNLASGLYYVRVQTDGKTTTQQLSVVK